MLEQDRLENLVGERKLSSNERELNRYIKENHEKMIKDQLQIARKKRSDDIRFNSNPVDVENIMVKTKWHVLKEKNMFKNKNMFECQKNIHKSNKNLLTSGNVLNGRNNLSKRGFI